MDSAMMLYYKTGFSGKFANLYLVLNGNYDIDFLATS